MPENLVSLSLSKLVFPLKILQSHVPFWKRWKCDQLVSFVSQRGLQDSKLNKTLSSPCNSSMIESRSLNWRKNEHFRHRPMPYHNSFPYFCCIIAYIWKNEVQRQLLEKEPKSNSWHFWPFLEWFWTMKNRWVLTLAKRRSRNDKHPSRVKKEGRAEE